MRGIHRVLLFASWFIIFLFFLCVSAWADPPSIVELQPDINWGGRTVAVDISPANTSIAIAATETGGLFRSTDGGGTWSHIESFNYEKFPLSDQPFRMSDVKFAPGNPEIVIASGWEDSRSNNFGGIWRSTDAGLTWEKPATSNPQPPDCGLSPVPAERASTWGIAFGGFPFQDVYVGTICGVAVSHDLGATWTHVSLSWTQSVVVALDGTVHTCSGDGHHSSVNRGASFGPPDPFVPGVAQCAAFGFHAIAASPLEGNVLFAATNSRRILESDDGGATWTDLSLPSGNSRDPWVKTHQSRDGITTHFDLYAGNGVHMYRQTCTNFGGPGLRCSKSWAPINVDHDDQSEVAFQTGQSPNSNCPQLVGSDGGVHTTADCGANWTVAGGGTGGFSALQLYEVTGQTHLFGSPDLYVGTQDNSLWASADDGASWDHEVCCEGYFIQVPYQASGLFGSVGPVTFTDCSPCSNDKSAAHFAGVTSWQNPPGAVVGHPFLQDALRAPGQYLQYSHLPSQPATASTLYVTYNAGQSWIRTASLLDTVADPRPSISRAVVYQAINKPGSVTGLIQINNIIPPGPYNIFPADNGLNNIATFCFSWGTFRCPVVFAVDPDTPDHLIAADAGTNEMKVSHDGGITWKVDPVLTSLITGNGEFLFSQEYFPTFVSQAHVIAFDPNNPQRILIGTEAAGIIFSLDGGRTWDTVSGSRKVPNISSFFFENYLIGGGRVLVSSYGRGLWQLDLPSNSSPAPRTAPAPVAQQIAATRQDQREGVSSPSNQPFLQLVGTIGPKASASGDSVVAYGSRFCGAPGCSPVTLKVGERVAAQQVPVTSDGRFEAKFIVTENPGIYIVTASQIAGDGSTIADSARLTVPATSARSSD